MITPQAMFEQMARHLLEDEKPSVFLTHAAGDPLFMEHPFDMLHALQDTEQSPVHHPEGSVWNHTLMVVDQAAQYRHLSGNAPVFMWAALLHDIGKPATTRVRKGRITAYDHDRVGAELAEQFLQALTQDSPWIRQVAALVRWHMQVMYTLKGLPFGDVEAMKRETDVREIALLGYCDRMGRTGADPHAEKAQIRLFLQKCGVDAPFDQGFA